MAFLEGKKDRGWVISCFRKAGVSLLQIDAHVNEARPRALIVPQRLQELDLIRDELYGRNKPDK